ncbi:(S)-ureidoglycine aminohydrolase [Mangrovicoccus sp. HB161399]|uniref:(S)-ureidoglycine aminohydrolase n=1 Tax=Mangrovicoccus sp. HB161399 TaxID=2720392 RepID=UPI00155422EB|nr:(S)-ureidoglycine aminohydrolase [Mangrovicoccus sp. HB161399]
MTTDSLARFGATRSDIRARHALLTPESHEWVTQPDWPGAELAVLVSPDMGARLSLSLVRCPEDAAAHPAAPGLARFVFCLEGGAALSDGTGLAPESFAFLPPGCGLGLDIPAGSRLAVFEWRFLPRGEVPGPLAGSLAGVPARALRGDDWLKVQKMLPSDPAFDFEVNVMSFRPGASLAYVETHFMEHGLLMLDGGGVYRLDGLWYPVQAGDAIWMGPHVPQWFGALGRTPSRYLICKNYNRSPMARA